MFHGPVYLSLYGTGFATDKEGNLYTAEVRTGRVQKYPPRRGANPDLLVGKPWPGVW